MGIVLFSAEGYIWGMNERCFGKFEKEMASRMIASEKSSTKEKSLKKHLHLYQATQEGAGESGGSAWKANDQN
jgi:hypothetical protein